MASQELVQQQPKAVDVGASVDGLATNLFWTGVAGGEQGDARGGRSEACCPWIQIQELGGPEIESLGHALLGNQDVGRFEVTMNDEPLMSVLDGTADFQKNLQPLIDGQASPNHREHARDVKTSIEKIIYKGKNLNRPGVEGIFGNMAFSHEIVHHIGGQADTNRNTTQRILLLLEATAVADAEGDSGGPFERTVRQVLYRYLHSDSNFHSQGDNESRIPRFLLNDIVRFWRTMCVDFAYKDWEQAGKKWAVRNVKLRTSRKLLFMSGLLAVFSCFKNEDLRRGEVSDEEYLLVLQGHMLSFVHSTPLDIVLWTLGQLGLQERRIAILDQYEKFLSIMNDESAREHLGSLSEENVYKDDTFLECRHISHELQSALSGVCFEEESELRDFTIEYGVF